MIYYFVIQIYQQEKCLNKIKCNFCHFLLYNPEELEESFLVEATQKTLFPQFFSSYLRPNEEILIILNCNIRTVSSIYCMNLSHIKTKFN